MSPHPSSRSSAITPVVPSESIRFPTSIKELDSTSRMAPSTTTVTTTTATAASASDALQGAQPTRKSSMDRALLRLHNNVLTSGNDFYDDGYNETELETEVPSTLFSNHIDSGGGKVDGDDINGFFGREKELRLLHRVFDQMMQHSKPRKPTERTKGNTQNTSSHDTPESESPVDASSSRSFAPAAFVWGTSGTGKSKLVDIFCDQLLDPGRTTNRTKHVRVLKGKFQEHQQGNPFSAITQSLSDWCKQLTSSRPSMTRSGEASSAATTGDGNADKHRHHPVVSQSSELQRLRSIIASSSLTMQQKDVLVTLVPALSILFGEEQTCDASITSSLAQPSQTAQISSTETSWNRFQYTFTQFLSLISSRRHPVVMVLDDLQWASQECMDLISTAMYQPHFLWIGTIRQEINPQSPNELMEFNANLPLMKFLGELQSQYSSSPDDTAHTDIHLQNFSKKELYDWVSQLFDQDDDVVDEVVELLHEQTDGNIFHTIQLLQDMERKKALTYSRITFQWELDPSLLSFNQTSHNDSSNSSSSSNNNNGGGGTSGNDDMDSGSKAAASNVVQLISSKLRSLPVPLQKALILASYIRSSFEFDTLQAVWEYEEQHNPTGSDILPTPAHALPPAGTSSTSRGTSTRSNDPGKTTKAKAEKPLAEWLEQAVLEGLLANSIGGASYRFAHDRIQQAARNLVPFGEPRIKLRLRIGQCLWNLCTSTNGDETNNGNDQGGDSSMFFIAADHLNCAPTKDHLAATRRNLQVGEYALQIAALVPAATYLQLASTSLRKVRGDPWQDQYDLMIRLVRSRCDIELTLNRFDLGYSLGYEVLDHGQSIHDKLPTYIAMANALGKQNEHMKGLQLAQQGVQLCGEYPKRWLVLRAFSQLFSVKAYLEKTSMEQFFEQNPITINPHTIHSMNLLHEVAIRAYSSQEMVAWMLATLLLIQMTKRDGICEYSAGALNGFAILQMKMGEFANAHKCAKIAKETIRRIHRGTKTEGWIYYAAAVFIDPYSKPFYQLRQDFQHAYDSAMAVGDVELSELAQEGSLYSSFFDGRPLTEVIAAASSLIEHMKIYKNEGRIGVVTELSNTSHYMRGTLKLDWEALMDADKYEQTDTSNLFLAYWCRLHIAVYFGKFGHAEKVNHLLRTSTTSDPTFDRFTSSAILSGVMASHRYHQTKKRKYLKMLRQQKRRLKETCEAKGMCAFHRYLILRAEWKAIKVGGTKPALVESCYNDAIKQARKGEHLHEAGLVCELAGKYMLKSSNPEDPRIRSYFTQALGFYEKWGALPKCRIFREAYGDYIDEDRVHEIKMESSLTGQVNSFALPQDHDQSSINQDMTSERTPSHVTVDSVADLVAARKARDSQAENTSKDGAMGSRGNMASAMDDNCSLLTDADH